MPAPRPVAHRIPGSRAHVAVGAWRLMRPGQWPKNVFVLGGLVFGREFTHPAAVLRAFVAFAAFCLLSSAVYCINDLADRERDRLHPRKRFRPIASGTVSPALAGVLAVALALWGLIGGVLVGAGVAAVGAAYLTLNILYSFVLKHVALWDALAVAGGFALRALAGTEAVHVPASPWLLVCTYLLTLYVSLGKRWADAVELEPEQRAHRGAAFTYDPDLMRLYMQVAMSATLISYALYATQGTHGPWMLLTLPFVIYGLFHYQHLVQSAGLGGAPDVAVLRDRAFILNGVLFAAVSVAVLLAAPM